MRKTFSISAKCSPKASGHCAGGWRRRSAAALAESTNSLLITSSSSRCGSALRNISGARR
ncbi:MAG: hypothetical protein R2911_28735 [Caldilineaceae bacterium]